MAGRGWNPFEHQLHAFWVIEPSALMSQQRTWVNLLRDLSEGELEAWHRGEISEAELPALMAEPMRIPGVECCEAVDVHSLLWMGVAYAPSIFHWMVDRHILDEDEFVIVETDEPGWSWYLPNPRAIHHGVKTFPGCIRDEMLDYPARCFRLVEDRWKSQIIWRREDCELMYKIGFTELGYGGIPHAAMFRGRKGKKERQARWMLGDDY